MAQQAPKPNAETPRSSTANLSQSVMENLPKVRLKPFDFTPVRVDYRKAKQRSSLLWMNQRQDLEKETVAGMEERKHFLRHRVRLFFLFPWPWSQSFHKDKSHMPTLILKMAIRSSLNKSPNSSHILPECVWMMSVKMGIYWCRRLQTRCALQERLSQWKASWLTRFLRSKKVVYAEIQIREQLSSTIAECKIAKSEFQSRQCAVNNLLEFGQS